MKQFIVILLSFFVLAGSVSDLAILMSFKINQTFIANNWCINKAFPKSKCQGKCYLKKQLKENRTTDSDNNTSPNIIEERINFICIKFENNTLKQLPLLSLKGFHFIDPVSHHFIHKIYHPPKELFS